MAAVDLGATSGRVMIGHVGPNELRLTPLSRFPNGPVSQPDGLHWPLLDLYRQLVEGVAMAASLEPGLTSIGVDTWAVDYALVEGGRIVAQPFHYRDQRTAVGVSATDELIAREELYALNGLQFLTFNTLYQLAADRVSGSLQTADSFLLIPDLIAFWLTGAAFAERTNASTTGLLDPLSRHWHEPLIERLLLPRRIFPELIDAGTTIGGLRPELVDDLGAGARLTVSAVASHDTASAVVAIPATHPDFAYISCGTWSLVGVELESPLLNEQGRLAGFTNELGADGRVRYLRNVMGLWLLNEVIAAWEKSGERIHLPSLLGEAGSLSHPVPIFDVDDPLFQPAGDMPTRIRRHCDEHGLRMPQSKAAMVRSILESLAVAYATSIEKARALTGKAISVIHLVGGGSHNALLCQLIADRTGLPVTAGPVEATAIGNVLVQARGQNLVHGDLETLRSLVARFTPQTHYLPR